MKKTLFCFALFVLVCAALVTGCQEKEEINYYGSLTIENRPSGPVIVFVFPSDIMPTNYEEYATMTTTPTKEGIAMGNGVSPVELYFFEGTHAGNYLTLVISGFTRRIVIGNYNAAGEAVVDWATMKPSFTPP
jgi:hypothetical protein